MLYAWRTTLGQMVALARIASFCISAVLLAAMARRARESTLLLNTKPPRIETPRAEIRGNPWEMPLCVMAAHSDPGADAQGNHALGPEISGTSLAEIPLLSSGQPLAGPALDPLQSALLASASDMSLQTLPSCPQAPTLVSGTRLFLDICAGATRPLSQAALQAGVHVLSVDPLCAGQLDLFNDLRYEQLLRLSFSGAVWFACASPPCGDFSTIKLRPGPGPKPIRTREHPFGIPDASASQLVRLQKSLWFLER